MKKQKVLLVENEWIIYDQLKDFFKEKGFEILENEESEIVNSYESAMSAIEKTRPDIAVLDIELDGEKDGIDLGIWLKKRFAIPIIYLSNNSNYVNIERIKQARQNSFILKSGSAFNEVQLWTTFQLELAKANEVVDSELDSHLFKAKKVVINDIYNRKSSILQEDRTLDKSLYIKWKDILCIETLNESMGQGKNKSLIHCSDGISGFIVPGSLASITKIMPYNFLQFDQQWLVNLQYISAKGRSLYVYYINDKRFEISDRFKDGALDKIFSVLGF